MWAWLKKSHAMPQARRALEVIYLLWRTSGQEFLFLSSRGSRSTLLHTFSPRVRVYLQSRAGTMMVAYLFLAAVALLSSVECHSPPSFLYSHEASPLTSTCPGQPNTHTPWSGPLTKLKEVVNGSLYLAGDADDQIYGRSRNRSTVKRTKAVKGLMDGV